MLPLRCHTQSRRAHPRRWLQRLQDLQLSITILLSHLLFTRLLLNSVRRETGTAGKYGKHRIKARSCSKIAGTSQRTLQTACDSNEPQGLNIFEYNTPVPWKLELTTLQGLASKCMLLSIIERPHNHRTKRSMSKLLETWCGKKININKYMLSSNSSTVFHGQTREFNEDSNNTSNLWINVAWVACSVWTAWRASISTRHKIDSCSSCSSCSCMPPCQSIWQPLPPCQPVSFPSTRSQTIQICWSKLAESSSITCFILKTKNLCSFHMVHNDFGFCRGIQLKQAENRSMILVVHSPNMENGAPLSPHWLQKVCWHQAPQESLFQRWQGWK